MSVEDLSETDDCCLNCGMESSKIHGWDVTVVVRRVGSFEFDSPHEAHFCTFGCYREWVDGDVTITVAGREIK